MPPFDMVSEDDGLDEASNGVIDLIDAGRLDEAEQAAQDLLARYPEVHDGLERVAMVAAARGDRARAAEYYRKAADFVHARPRDTTLRWRGTCGSGPPNSARPPSEGQPVTLREGATPAIHRQP